MNRQSERTLKTAYKINIRQIEIYDLDLSKTSEEVIFIRGNWNKNEGFKKVLMRTDTVSRQRYAGRKRLSE